ncbi:MAG: hypothetical protein C0392_13105 [Syntrophus sp. (in: bacteria)]|nr:hypothetical protein [Syntrophus sp. (in: bacteria)]
MMRWLVLLLCLICSVLFLYNIQSRDFWAPDEGDFAEISRELDNDLIVPHLNNKPYGEKPPLFYYITYGSHKILSPFKDELAMRIPTALSAMGWAVFFFITIARFFTRKEAILATAILITAPLYYWQARYLQVDMVFAALTACSMLSFFRFTQGGRRVFYYLFFVFAGLAFMTKGPLSVVLIFPAVFIYLVTEKDFSLFRKKETVLGCIVFAAIILPWYLAIYFREGFPYLYENVFRQNFIRFFDAWSHKRPFYYYLMTLPLDFFPWSLFLPVGIYAAFTRLKEDPKIRFFLIWAAWMFLFFSLSSGKISKYMLPLLPPLALLSSTVFLADKSTYRNVVFIILSVLFFILGGMLFFYKTDTYVQFYAHRLVIGAFAVALSGAIIIFLRGKRPLYVFAALLLFMGATYTAANTSVYKTWNPYKSPKALAERIKPLIKDGTPWVYYGSMRGVYIYYVGTYATHVDEHDTEALRALTKNMNVFYILARKRDMKEAADVLPGLELVFEEKIGDTPMVLLKYGGNSAL